MKKYAIPRFTALILTLCLLVSNASLVLAATDSTPSVSEISAESVSLANHIKPAAITADSLNSASNFYNTSRLLTLLVRSGIDCSDLTQSYATVLKESYMNESGNLTVEEPMTAYPYAIIVLTLAGYNVTSFNNSNLITGYEAVLNAASQTDFNNCNPYKLSAMYFTARAYHMNASCTNQIKNALLNYGNENGIDYWGNSSDNNGLTLSGFASLYASDNDVTSLVNKALTWNESTLLHEDGTSQGDLNWSKDPNTDSTATALALYSSFGKTELAVKSYYGLLKFKLAGTTGYTYLLGDTSENAFAENDALFGLITYKRVLTGQTNPFDISDILNKIPEPTTSAEPTNAESEPQTSQPVTAAPEQTTVVVTPTPASTSATEPASFEVLAVESSCAEVTDSNVKTGDSNMIIIFSITAMLSLGTLILSNRKKLHTRGE